MSEAEWRVRADSHEVLRALRQTLPRAPCGISYTVRTPERKMRLFAVASRAGRHDRNDKRPNRNTAVVRGTGDPLH